MNGALQANLGCDKYREVKLEFCPRIWYSIMVRVLMSFEFIVAPCSSGVETCL
jgi:hypothetical protein